MGPHVFACGNSAATTERCGRPTGFNGAARFCVRKSGPTASLGYLRPNASMGPHVFACGNGTYKANEKILTLTLQWGRTFLRAEIRWRVEERNAGFCASMGPHVFACGNVAATIRAIVSRGRFNGAARFCVRKSRLRPLHPVQDAALQWGRTFLRAEISPKP